MTNSEECRLSVKPELCTETVTLEVNWDLLKTEKLDPSKMNSNSF